MALHRAACHTNHHQHQHHVQQQDQQQHHASTSSMMTHLFPNRAASSHDNNNDDALRVNNNASVAAPPPPPPPPPPAAEMVRCATCGKQISALSAMVHEATCHRQHHHQEENEHDDDDNNNSPNSTMGLQVRPDAAEAPVLGQQQQQDETASRTVGTSTSTAGSPSSETTQQQQQHQQQEWSCPRCTLLNDPTDHYCQACGYFSGGHRTTTAGSSSSSSATATTTTATSPSTIRVEVREMDPRFVTAVTTAASILSWTALGALVAGPVGGAVGGIGAALAAAGAAASGNNNNNHNNNNQPPRFTFTSTRITPTGATTTRYVTSSGSSNNNNNSTSGGGGGPLRTVIIRAPDGVFHGGSVADRMILQMLVLNALNQGATDVDQMTYDELLQRFGVGSEHRGASQETIRDLPLTKLDHAAMEALNENQKTCNICLEDLKEGDEMRKLPDCSHVFHRQCIDEWLGRVASCPICKKEIQR